MTTVPFFKNNTIQIIVTLFRGLVMAAEEYAWLIFIPIIILIVTAVSNGANLTDGIDGLAAGSSAIIVFTLGCIYALVSGNIFFLII